MSACPILTEIAVDFVGAVFAAGFAAWAAIWVGERERKRALFDSFYSDVAGLSALKKDCTFHATAIADLRRFKDRLLPHLNPDQRTKLETAVKKFANSPPSEWSESSYENAQRAITDRNNTGSMTTTESRFSDVVSDILDAVK